MVSPNLNPVCLHPPFNLNPIPDRTRLSPEVGFSKTLEAAQKKSPTNPPSYRFCVPDEWYRRSRTRTLSSGSLTPSEATIRRLADLQESEEEDEEESAEDEGTTKARPAATQSPGSSPEKSGDWRGTFSQTRLSSMFEGWLPSGPTPAAPVESSVRNRRTSVSEPIPVQAESAESDPDDLSEFEEMMVKWTVPIRSYHTHTLDRTVSD